MYVWYTPYANVLYISTSLVSVAVNNISLLQSLMWGFCTGRRFTHKQKQIHDLIMWRYMSSNQCCQSGGGHVDRKSQVGNIWDAAHLPSLPLMLSQSESNPCTDQLKKNRNFPCHPRQQQRTEADGTGESVMGGDREVRRGLVPLSTKGKKNRNFLQGPKKVPDCCFCHVVRK